MLLIFTIVLILVIIPISGLFFDPELNPPKDPELNPPKDKDIQ